MSTRDSLQHHALSIDALMSSIPAKHLQEPTEAHESMLSNKYMKNKKQPAEIKVLAKQARKLKFDPPANQDTSALVETAVVAPMQSLSITDLRLKLQAKIASLRRGRGADKRKEEKRPDKKKEKKPTPTPKTGNTNKRKTEEQEEDTTAVNSENETKKPKTIIDDVSFGILSFGDEKKKKAGIDTMSKLKKVESKQAKFDKIKEKNPEKALYIEGEQKWDKLFSLAEGTKVMDDPKLLKKTLKREEKKKEKSASTWVDRKDTVRKHEEDGQKRRNENLLARKEGRPTKRNTSKRPGFEGGRAKKEKKK